VEDPKIWNFTRLKIAFEAIPEDFKKNHPCVKTTPAVLRQWFVEHGRNLPMPGGGMAPQQVAPQQQQVQPQAQQQFNNFPPQQTPQQNFDQYQQPDPGLMDGGMMGGMMGNMMGGALMGGMGGFAYDMGGMMGDPNELMQMTRGKYNQIKERFQERDLELKQAHLQIQLMQLQIEKLESENRALKEGQMMGQPRQRRDTSSLFDL